MKFILSNGEQFRENVQEFPLANELLCSKILVACVANNFDVVAACGVRSVFNVLVLHVKEGYRGRGIGLRTLKKAISAARKRGLSFIILSVTTNNVPALNLYSKSGFRGVVGLKKLDLIVMMLPLALKGELAYRFLRMVCSALPNIFLAHIHEWLYKITIT